MIPLCDLQQQYSVLKEEIDEVMQQVAAEANYILGSNVRAFEQEMAAYCGCRHAIGVGSGTDALHLSLRALNIGPGDEVITTPFTFIGTTEAICMVGAKPVFVDIDSRTYNVDVSLLEAAITDRTKAILPVHLYGQPCDMGRIVQVAETYELAIVEDCAQAVGATYQGKRVGTFGKAGCLSFFPSKNLGCFGDGGMVLTNDSQVFERVEMLRRHGGKVKYHHSEIGLNSRLDELQAAILRVKLRYLDGWNRSRREHAYRYNRFLESVPEIQRPGEFGVRDSAVPTCTSEANEGIEAVYHQYTVSVADRETIQSGLGDAGIASAIYYPVPLHLQEVHRDLGLAVGTFPVAESASKHCLSLPMFPELTEEQAFSVAERLRRLTALECQAA
ncbi:MAG: DegT/DnrJ/EryC1/StrS family aminotransferase [Planctomycetales bacterium]|nr:DegT/DnrJ/EryC1/StrS family aminotransferase [Planctomycetales bacterium]